MHKKGATAGFEKWVEAVFDHPVTKQEWYWAPEFEAQWASLELSNAVTVTYLTRLYSDASILSRFSLEQVAQGIWFLVGESSPAKPSYCLLRSLIPLRTRVACVSAMANFFAQFVAVKAPGPADTTDRNPFHVACHMWWDILPVRGGTRVHEPELDQACLAAMAKILNLPSELCQLSALHGLNHWHRAYGAHVEQTVDAFLSESHDLSVRVREYAARARCGKAL